MTGCASERVYNIMGRPTPLPPFIATGTFKYENRLEGKGAWGMWSLNYEKKRSYTLTLYSSIGTLISCVRWEGTSYLPCSKKACPVEMTRVLPLQISGDLPQILLGMVGRVGLVMERDKRGRVLEALIHGHEEMWMVLYSYYLSVDEIPYPTLISLTREDEKIRISIRIEEVELND